MKSKVVVISGHAQHGKDTVAQMLQDQFRTDGYRAIITHFADLLKYICRTYLEWDGKKDDAGRSLLQYVGTTMIREEQPNFWVDFIADILHYFGNHWDFVIIPDTRFPNEIQRLKERGFDTTHIRVIRTDFDNLLSAKQKSHQSETALDNINPDYKIVNSSGLRELRISVETLITEGFYENK